MEGTVRERTGVSRLQTIIEPGGYSASLGFGVVGVIPMETYHNCRCEDHGHKSQADQNINHFSTPLGDALNVRNRIQPESDATSARVVQLHKEEE